MERADLGALHPSVGDTGVDDFLGEDVTTIMNLSIDF